MRRILVPFACLLTLGCLSHPKNQPPVKVTGFSSLYDENCAGCHGADGKNGPARILHDAVLVAYMPPEQIKLVILNGRPGTPMPAFGRDRGGALNDGQVDTIVRGIESWGRPIADIPAYTPMAAGDSHSGAKLFAQNCFMCHAKGGSVGPVTDPNYLILVSDQAIRSSIVTGRPDLGMPDWRHLHLGKALTDQDITDLSAYLVSLRPASANAALEIDSKSTRNGTGGGDRSATSNSGTKQ